MENCWPLNGQEAAEDKTIDLTRAKIAILTNGRKTFVCVKIRLLKTTSVEDFELFAPVGFCLI